MIFEAGTCVGCRSCETACSKHLVTKHDVTCRDCNDIDEVLAVQGENL